jgi:hypothetical protein
MSSRPRIPVLIGAVCAAVLLAGCSSSGTISGGSSNDSSGGFTGGTSGGSTGSSGGTSGGNGGTDAGCAQALLAVQNAEKAQNSSNPQTALNALNTSIGQLRNAAGKTQKPGGKDAMNKVADDLEAIKTQAQSGQNPSTQQALDDAQQIATICGA